MYDTIRDAVLTCSQKLTSAGKVTAHCILARNFVAADFGKCPEGTKVWRKLINDTINKFIFFKLQSAFCWFQTIKSFRVLLFGKIASVYFISKMSSYFSTVNVQPREPSLCRLYRHTSPLLYIVLTWLICVNAVDGLAGDVGAVLNTLPYSGMRQVRLLIACSRPVYFRIVFLCVCKFLVYCMLQMPSVRWRCWLVWLSVWIEVQIVCIWSSWCHCIPKPHHLLPPLNPDWFYLSGTGLPRLSWKRGR